MNEPIARPLEFRQGRAKLLAWARQTAAGVRYHFSVRCLYPDRETGKLKEGQSFDLRDLVNLAHAALEANAWYRGELRTARGGTETQEAEPADAQPQSSDEPEAEAA